MVRGGIRTVTLTTHEANRIAALLARVVPTSTNEQAEVLTLVELLQGGRK